MQRVLSIAIVVLGCLALSSAGCGKQEPAKPPAVAVTPSKDGDKKDPPPPPIEKPTDRMNG